MDASLLEDLNANRGGWGSVLDVEPSSRVIGVGGVFPPCFFPSDPFLPMLLILLLMMQINWNVFALEGSSQDTLVMEITCCLCLCMFLLVGYRWTALDARWTATDSTSARLALKSIV